MSSRRAEAIALLALQIFAALSAIAGGIGLVSGMIALPMDWLNNSVFSDYAIPGIILGAIVGGTQVAALIYAYGRQEAYLFATSIAGGVLMGWIIGELLVVGSADATMLAYQLVYFLVGFVEFSLGAVELRQRVGSN